MSLTRRTPALGSVAPEDPVASIELDKVKPESENLLESKNGDTPDGEINHVRIILGGERHLLESLYFEKFKCN